MLLLYVRVRYFDEAVLHIFITFFKAKVTSLRYKEERVMPADSRFRGIEKYCLK